MYVLYITKYTYIHTHIHVCVCVCFFVCVCVCVCTYHAEGRLSRAGSRWDIASIFQNIRKFRQWQICVLSTQTVPLSSGCRLFLGRAALSHSLLHGIVQSRSPSGGDLIRMSSICFCSRLLGQSKISDYIYCIDREGQSRHWWQTCGAKCGVSKLPAQESMCGSLPVFTCYQVSYSSCLYLLSCLCFLQYPRWFWWCRPQSDAAVNNNSAMSSTLKSPLLTFALRPCHLSNLWAGGVDMMIEGLIVESLKQKRGWATKARGWQGVVLKRKIHFCSSLSLNKC